MDIRIVGWHGNCEYGCDKAMGAISGCGVPAKGFDDPHSSSLSLPAT